MKNSKLAKSIVALLAIVALLVPGVALAQEWTPDKDQQVEQLKPYSPYVDQHFPQKVFFGDTHFHSSLSVDSGMVGNRVDLDQAFRFAQGEEIVTSTGQRAQLNRPLDFLVVSDHAEYLGLADLIAHRGPGVAGNRRGPGVVRSHARRAGMPPGAWCY